MLLVRRREFEQLLVEEDDREAALVDRREMLRLLRVRGEDVLAVFVEDFGLEAREPGRVLDAGEPVAQHRRNELRPQLLGIDGKCQHAGHPRRAPAPSNRSCACT